MVNVTTRSGKGDQLTFAELDANFTDLASAVNFLLPQDIPFGTSIPLTGNLFMPQQSVAGAMSFTASAGAVKGARTYLRLVANGANVPTFTGMKEWGGSAGYDNRPGIINQIEFFYDGNDYWYYVSQAVGATAVDTVAPTASNSVVQNASPTTLTISMSEALDPAYTPASTAFAVSGHTVSAVSISGTSIVLTVSAFVNGEAARTVSYAQPGTNNARDMAGNLLANFTGLSVTNNVQPADVTAPTFVSAQVANAAPAVIVITMSEALAAITPATSAFTVSGGKTVSSVSVSGSTVSVTVSSAYSGGDAITVAYTQPGTSKLQDVAGNAVATFGAQSVANNVSAAATAPGAPTIGAATAGEASASVAFTAPASNGGAAITSYTVTSSPGGITASGSASPINVTGLTNGTAYTFTVTATNSVGTGPASAASNSVTPAASVGYPKMSSLIKMAESGSGPYTYTGTTSTNLGGNEGGSISKMLPSGVDGHIVIKVHTMAGQGSNEVLMGFDASATTLTSYAGYDYLGIARTTTNSVVFYTNNASIGGGTGNPAVNDLFKIARVGSTLTYSMSKDNGATWSLVKEFTGVSTADRYFHVGCAYLGSFTLMETSGLVA